MPNDKIETPRTDEKVGFMASGPAVVPADFARTLERELNEAKAEIMRLARCIADDPRELVELRHQLRDMTDRFFAVSQELAKEAADSKTMFDAIHGNGGYVELLAQAQRERDEYRSGFLAAKTAGTQLAEANRQGMEELTTLRAQNEALQEQVKIRGEMRDEAIQEMNAALQKCEALAKDSWKTGVPSTPIGESESLLVAIRPPSGKTYIALLDYLNRHVMPCSDDCEPCDDAIAVGDDGDYEWTGWFEQSCEHCDTHWRFSDEKSIIAWMPMPKYGAARLKEVEGRR